MIHDEMLVTELNTLKSEMDTKNTDLVISVIGKERSGKSTLAVNLIKVLDPTITPDNLAERVCLSFGEFARIVPTIQPYQAIWCDGFGWYNRRRNYEADINQIMLQYFQESGSSKRIYILCYPELQEINPKVLQRSRLFFETIRSSGKYYVRGWTREQIGLKLREVRLPSQESRDKLWGHCSKSPRVFQCDYEGIEELMKAHKGIEAKHLTILDNKMKEFSNRR